MSSRIKKDLCLLPQKYREYYFLRQIILQLVVLIFQVFII